MRVAFSPSEMPIILSALNVMIDFYARRAHEEKNPADRDDLLAHKNVAEEFLEMLRPYTNGHFELSPGDLAVLERALRMSTAKWQAMIRPEMSAEQKKLHRDSADDVAAVMTRLRKERGLPW